MRLDDPSPQCFIPPDQFRFIFERVNCFCMDIVVANEKGVLLVKREIEPFQGKFVLPGGFVLFKEPINVALRRLALKELGVICVSHRELGHIQHIEDGPWRSTISLVFLVEYKGQLQGCDEGEELKFFSEFGRDVQPYQREFLLRKFQEIMSLAKLGE